MSNDRTPPARTIGWQTLDGEFLHAESSEAIWSCSRYIGEELYQNPEGEETLWFFPGSILVLERFRLSPYDLEFYPLLPNKEIQVSTALIWLHTKQIPHVKWPAFLVDAFHERAFRRLRLRIEGNQVSLDGHTVLLEMTAEARADIIKFLSYLIRENGGWISSSDMRLGRCDRLCKKLPSALLSLIEKKPRKGFRLLPDAWRNKSVFAP
jgi:hypothetical protein